MGNYATAEQLRDEVRGNNNTLDGSDKSLVDQLVTKTVGCSIGATLATSAGATYIVGSPAVATPVDGTANPKAMKVVQARVTSSAALTASDTDNAVFTLNSYTAAGVLTAAVAVMTTNVALGSFAAGQTKVFTLTSANVVIPAGGCLGLVITKGGSGVSVTVGTKIEADCVPTG